MSNPVTAKNNRLSAVPSVDELLRTEAAAKLRDQVGLQRVKELARGVTEEIRGEIKASESSVPLSRSALLLQSVRRLEDACTHERQMGIRRIINATGVILHTNLGRAPLSDAAREAIANQAAGYCTLEFDSVSGLRGRRGARVEQLLIGLTGAEDALVVNNCASAALLILTVLARDGETIVSRGELIEIGGDFRVPDVMSNSGTRMIEVGTTNRTRLQDYQRAITERTRLIMRVHPSNYRIVGFTTSPALSELAALAHESNLVLYEDAGSGVLTNLSEHGLSDEPIIQDCISDGADVVSFSGDKLLGATQSGLIVGRRKIVGRLRKHSLYRALRADKLTLAALEVTLGAHRRGSHMNEIPTLRMLALSAEEIAGRANALVKSLCERVPDSRLNVSVIAGESAVGGGSGPNTHPKTVLISLIHNTLSESDIQRRLRSSSPSIIARISDAKVLLDLRTVAPKEDSEVLDALVRLAKEDSHQP